MELFEQLINNIKGKGRRIVFTEGEDVRILKAACKLSSNDILTPVLLGDISTIKKVAKQNNICLDKMELLNMNEFPKLEEMIHLMLQVRRGKINELEARQLLTRSNYFGTMLVKMGYADCLLGGVSYSTADTVRPALQLIKTKPGSNIVSSMFILIRNKDGVQEKLVMGDCAININPDEEQLVEIAYQAALNSKAFGIEPVVAMLSYSSLGSGKGESVDKVREATKRLKNMALSFPIDGELQFDAAIDDVVAKIKAPYSNVAGKANVLIFPNIDAGNIGYKIAQRLGGFEALGPILLGLNAPINDLSRGCNAEEVYKMAIITANQK